MFMLSSGAIPLQPSHPSYIPPDSLTFFQLKLLHLKLNRDLVFLVSINNTLNNVTKIKPQVL